MPAKDPVNKAKAAKRKRKSARRKAARRKPAAPKRSNTRKEAVDEGRVGAQRPHWRR